MVCLQKQANYWVGQVQSILTHIDWGIIAETNARDWRFVM